MSLLLDTHVFLWWLADDRRLGPPVRDAVAASEMVFVSAASAWEAAIKKALGKLVMDHPFGRAVRDSGFEPLNITVDHAERVAGLPAHHADPFDRMLVVQAAAEGLTLVTHDRRFEPYGVPVLWA